MGFLGFSLTLNPYDSPHFDVPAVLPDKRVDLSENKGPYSRILKSWDPEHKEPDIDLT